MNDKIPTYNKENANSNSAQCPTRADISRQRIGNDGLKQILRILILKRPDIVAIFLHETHLLLALQLLLLTCPMYLQQYNGTGYI